jgi:membrane-bound serine protease (ClpP class)
MLRFFRQMTIVLALAASIAVQAQAPERPSTAGTPFPEAGSGAPPESGYVVLVKIDGTIDDGVAVVVERAVKEARNAEALVFVIDTPGGLVDSAIEITRHILSAPCPTYAYIEGMGAISAGALISYACDHIVMGPATSIGASMPITMGGELPEDVEEKSMSFLRAKFRALGEENRHNPLIGEAMVDRAIELYGLLNPDGAYTTYKVVSGAITDTYTQPLVSATDVPAPAAVVSGVSPAEALRAQNPTQDSLPDIIRKLTGDPAPVAPVAPEAVVPDEAPAQPSVRPDALPAGAVAICDAKKLLTLTTDEALRYQLSPLKAENLTALLSHFGLDQFKKHYVVPTFAEMLFAWLTSPMISGLLLMLGIGGLYLEVRTPGLGLAGAVGAACLALFFGAYLILGIADWADVLLVAVGLGLIVVEIFFLPGFGVAGVAGIVCTVLGLYLAMVRVPIPEYEWELTRLSDAGQTLLTTLTLLIAFGIATWKLLPRTPFARWLVLDEAQLAGAGYVVQTQEEQALAAGQHGVATTVLRPAGKARFDGRNFDVVTRGEYLKAGTPVAIIRADGNRHVVAALPPDSPAER